MFRPVLVDHGKIVGYLDDRGLLTTDRWKGCTFPTMACAIKVLRDSRRLERNQGHGEARWGIQTIDTVGDEVAS